MFEKFAEEIQRGQSPTPEMCDSLGYRASQMAIDAKIDLTDAVVKVAGEHPNLNNRHLTTICHVANNEYFRKIASARKQAGQNLVFEYPLADPSEVCKQINAEASPKTAHVRFDRDYMEPHRRASDLLADWNPFADPQFGKSASRVQSNKDRRGRIKEAAEELAHLHEHTGRVAELAQRQAEATDAHASSAQATFNKLYKQAALSGITQAEILDLLSYHPVASEDMLVSCVEKAASYLAGQEPRVFKKHAHTIDVRVRGMADTTHPLYVAFDECVQTKLAQAKMHKVSKYAQVEYRTANSAYKRVATAAASMR